MYLGECLGPEKIDYEYKEFCLKLLPYDYFSEKEIISILHGQWHSKMNALILENISIYIKTYLTKCISAFYNSQITGQLIFGCNDFGEVCGIPYQCLNENDLVIFKNFIQHQIQSEINHNLSKIVKPNIFIEELEINDAILDDEIKPLLKNYLSKTREYNIKHKKYTRKKKKWFNHVLKYSAKLNILLNTPDIRKEFVQFMKDQNGDSDVIKFIDESGYISAPSGEDMKHARDMKTTNTLAYWLAYFKDTKLDIVMQKKPKRPLVQIPQNPFMIIQRLSLLRKRFANKRKIKYFIIKIQVEKSSHNFSKENLILFNDTDKGWISNVRLSEERGPYLSRIDL